MGKYRRYKNRIEMFLASDKGKRVLNFFYSWGAAVVILGAMFKLLHLPYGDLMLAVGMITRVLCILCVRVRKLPWITTGKRFSPY